MSFAAAPGRPGPAPSLSAAQTSIFELALQAIPLAEALDGLVRTVEAHSASGMLASVLLLDDDGEHLRLGAGPSLPAAYNAAIDGIAIGPTVGSCGTAVHRKEPVVVADIATDPLWVDFRELALGHQLRACWSWPIVSGAGAVLGTFAMYHRVPREPAPADIELVGFVLRSAALLIERKLIEERARHNEARIRFILAAGRLGAWELDLVSGALTTSPTCRLNFGRNPDADFSYDELRDAVHPDDQARMRGAVERSVANRDDYDIEYRVLTPDGDIRWIAIRAQPSYDDHGKPLRMSGVSIDITGRKATETALIELNDTLERRVEVAVADRERAWNAARDLLLIIGADGIIRAVNPAWTTTLGWRADELVGQSYADFVHPEDLAASRAALVTATTEALATRENRYRHKDGSWRWLSWVSAPEGGVIYANARDITAEKEHAAELAMAQDALRQSQKMEAMGSLTGGVAHDFNNLLTPIVGSLDLLQRRGVGNEREQRLIAGAMQSAERAKVLVQRLLAFARRQPLQAVAVDLGALVAGMADLVASTTGPQIRVAVEVADALPAAIADPNQLEMALLNLAVNARDAMPDGGTLRITAAAEPIAAGHRTGLPAGRYLCLSVADTGDGMDEMTLDRAIEPFFSTKGVGKGTGLGLSMVHGLAQQLGGALTIQSRRGIGTNVEFWLPESAAPAEAVEQAAAAARQAAPAGTVLLVDDEDMVRLSTAEMLSDLGYRVTEARCAEEALDLVRDGLRPTLLVTDHLMPGMTGSDLARTMRNEHPDIRVLIISGYAESEGLSPDLPRLTKPFRNDELAASLANR